MADVHDDLPKRKEDGQERQTSAERRLLQLKDPGIVDNLVSEEAKGGEDKASLGQGVEVARTAQSSANGRRSPSASPRMASRGDVSRPVSSKPL